MSRNLLKTAIGMLLLPLLVSVSMAFYGQFGTIEKTWTESQRYFLAGIVVYCLIQLLLFKPAYIYVLGHETVHALATLLCLGKVRSFKVSPSGGSVSTSKSNLFINLSPYFVPIYAILLIVAYNVAIKFFSTELLKTLYFMFLLGMTLSFHIVMTIDTLKTKQPDLVKAGSITSMVLIYVTNVAIVALTLGLLFDGFSFRSFINNAYILSIDIYNSIFKQLFL